MLYTKITNIEKGLQLLAYVFLAYRDKGHHVRSQCRKELRGVLHREISWARYEIALSLTWVNALSR